MMRPFLRPKSNSWKSGRPDSVPAHAHLLRTRCSSGLWLSCCLLMFVSLFLLIPFLIECGTLTHVWASIFFPLKQGQVSFSFFFFFMLDVPHTSKLPHTLPHPGTLLLFVPDGSCRPPLPAVIRHPGTGRVLTFHSGLPWKSDASVAPSGFGAVLMHQQDPI